MSWLRKIIFRFQPLWSRQKIETELTEELRHHLEMATAANIAAGMSADAAQRAAQLELGGIEQVKEAYRDERGLPWIEHFIQDLKYAARQLRKNPGFTVVAALSLALSIGASTAVFSIANQLLLKPLPVRNPDDLVHFAWMRGVEGGSPQGYYGTGDDVDPASGQQLRTSFSFRTFASFRQDHPLLAHVFAFHGIWGPNVSIDGRPEVGGPALLVSGNYYDVLGVHAFRGRTLGPADDEPDAVPAAVLSHRYWQSRFGGDPAAIGKVILVNQIQVTVVGIASPGFLGPTLDMPADITLPLAVAPLLMNGGMSIYRPGQWWLRIMGRLKPGVTAEQASASLEGSFRASARDGWTKSDDSPRLRTLPGSAGRSMQSRQRLESLLQPRIAMVALLLAAACANVANLLLARAACRRREIGVRLALGASRSRLIRQLLAESFLLATLGAVPGALLAAWGADLLWWGQGEVFSFDPRVLGFTIALTVLTAVGFGLAPALRATRLNLTEEFQGGPRTLGVGTRLRLSRTLMVVQVTVSFVLVVGAVLFVQSLRNLRAVEIGFNRTNLLLFSVDGFSTGHTWPELAGLYSRIAERIETKAGIRSATYSAGPILGGFDGGRATVSVPPAAVVAVDEGTASNEIGPGFFETLEIPIRIGRDFDARDHASSAPGVTVINQSFARKYFGGENPVGRRVRIDNAEREVVGVAGDVKQIDLRKLTPPTVYIPSAQRFYGAAHFAIRTVGSPEGEITSIREAVKEIDPNLPLVNVRPQEAEIERLLTIERVFTHLGVFFGLVALLLVCAGLYGLASYAVLSRTGEIGIRMALGALPAQVLWMIMRESVLLAVSGVLIGVVIAAGAIRLLGNLLFGLSATDPSTYAAAAVALVAVAMVAALGPARRAIKIDPMLALRCE